QESEGAVPFVARFDAFGSGRGRIFPSVWPGVPAIGRGGERQCAVGLFRWLGQLLDDRLLEEVAHLGVGAEQPLNPAAEFGVTPAGRVQVGGARRLGPYFQGGKKQGFHVRCVAHDLDPCEGCLPTMRQGGTRPLRLVYLSRNYFWPSSASSA